MALRYQDADVASFGAACVIDTLRASTTMSFLLARGAKALRAVAEVDTAFQMRSRDPSLLLGGERGNRALPGFDGGNSPNDWPAEKVAGRQVVFTTTNGTQAIQRVLEVKHLVLAALINASAVARYLQSLHCPVLVVASGAKEHLALEDVLAAGAIARHWPRHCRTDAAELATALFQENQDHLESTLRLAAHGQDLLQMGLDDDLRTAAQLDVVETVPVMSAEGWFVSLR